MKTSRSLIVIDDDPLNNFICRALVKGTVGETVNITEFTDPELALKHIISTRGNEDDPTIIFLDINMPTIDGWQFLDRFATFPEYIQKRFIIYMVSSSVDFRDKQRAATTSSVMALVPKPITRNFIGDLFSCN